jgi:hypothetical protein
MSKERTAQVREVWALVCLDSIIRYGSGDVLTYVLAVAMMFVLVTVGRMSTRGMWNALQHGQGTAWYSENALPVCEVFVIVVLLLVLETAGPRPYWDFSLLRAVVFGSSACLTVHGTI